MKKGSTTFLKLVIACIAVAIFAGLLYFPQVEGRNANSDWLSLYFNDPFLIYVYTASIAFFIGSYQLIKLLGLIENNKTFSLASAKSLGIIKICSLAMSGFISVAMPWLIMFAHDDDSPGVVLIGIVAVFASASIAYASAIFQKQIQKRLHKGKK